MSVNSELKTEKSNLDNSTESVFVRACRRKKTPFTPIWLMRQAGRFMPEYQKVRAKVGFLELCKNPELATEVTVTAQEKLNTDAAIIFADILLPLEPMGVGLEYTETAGPVILKPIRVPEHVIALKQFEPEIELDFVCKAIRLAKVQLNETPLIGFAGAPFTLASYLIEGGSSRNFENTKSFMYKQQTAWHALMDRLVNVSISYINGQIEAGVQAIQLFDSWVGCLSPYDYKEFVQKHVRRLVDGIISGVPVIHFGTGSAGLIELMRDAGGDVIGLDWRVELDEAWNRLGFNVAVQGNLDPAVLLADRAEIRKRVTDILNRAAGRPGHIFNLGHGVFPQTPVENVRYLVELVHELSCQMNGYA